MWAIGVTLYAMVGGRMPWQSHNTIRLIAEIRKAEYTIPLFVSDQCRDLIARLMSPAPGRRPTAADALAHPWLRSPPERISNSISCGAGPSLSVKAVDAFFRRGAIDFECPT